MVESMKTLTIKTPLQRKVLIHRQQVYNYSHLNGDFYREKKEKPNWLRKLKSYLKKAANNIERQGIND